MTKEVRAILLMALSVGTVCLGLIALRLRNQQPIELPNQEEKPKIEEMFACGDYCPGPQGLYMKKVYSGVNTEEGCRQAGGTWNSFIGWGTTYYCEVK